MALTAGTRLGPYEITGRLGTGGMGEVYRATDTKLGREVAIKTLPSALAEDADRLARFEREAKLLAALNHAHIGAIYGLDEHEGTQFLAMELVEGETLEEKLEAGSLPTDDALRLALQIAEALEAAHEKGVVHRDLKPANIMVTGEGQVKVLDFGLAKAFSGDPNQAAPAHSPALSVAMTQQGLILGTAGYMSPEQASGQATDQRADIWAFGVVLYEMLTGLPLFSGESVPHILADVLRAEPDWDRLPKPFDPRLKALLERCLEKKVRNRYHSIADVRVDIEKILSDPEGGRAPAATAAPTGRRLPLTAALVAVALLAGGLIWSLMRSAPSTPAPIVSRFVVTPPPTAPLASLGGYDLAVSPDGKRLAYFAQDPQTGGAELYVRDVDELDARAVPGAEVAQPGGGNMNPFFSPDGQWVGFRSPGKGIMRVSVSGEPPLKIADDPDGSAGVFLGATWASDGTVIYAAGARLYRISAGGGGTPEPLTSAWDAANTYESGPVLLPGGHAVLFNVIGETEQVAVLDLDTGEQKILVQGGTQVSYAPTGHLVFIRGTTLMAVPFDVDRLAVTGEPVALLQGVRHPGPTTAADYALSDAGTLVYVPGTAETATAAVVWVDRDGRVAGRAVADSVENPRDPRLSPDGGRLVLTTGPVAAGNLWVYDLSGRPPIPIADEDDDRYAAWSPDATQLAFTSIQGTPNVYTAAADGSVLDPMPLRAEGLGAATAVWSADGELILVTNNQDIVATPADAEGDVRDVVVTPDQEFDAALSPNGRWLAYASTRTGRVEVWVKGYPDGVPVRVSRNGGREPVWSHDGKELYYLQGNAMMAVPVETEETFSFDPAVQLFTQPYFVSVDPYARSYDVARDGRFLMVQPSGASADGAQTSNIVVVQNWFEELKRLAPTP
jgi:Tol biopolymer transport system component/predicted Ser/Thr protein kinase